MVPDQQRVSSKNTLLGRAGLHKFLAEATSYQSPASGKPKVVLRQRDGDSLYSHPGKPPLADLVDMGRPGLETQRAILDSFPVHPNRTLAD